MGALHVEGPAPEDFDRIAQLVETYADFPLGGTSVVANGSGRHGPLSRGRSAATGRNAHHAGLRS
jgi:hypothetical protein